MRFQKCGNQSCGNMSIFCSHTFTFITMTLSVMNDTFDIPTCANLLLYPVTTCSSSSLRTQILWYCVMENQGNMVVYCIGMNIIYMLYFEQFYLTL